MNTIGLVEVAQPAAAAEPDTDDDIEIILDSPSQSPAPAPAKPPAEPLARPQAAIDGGQQLQPGAHPSVPQAQGPEGLHEPAHGRAAAGASPRGAAPSAAAGVAPPAPGDRRPQPPPPPPPASVADARVTRARGKAHAAPVQGHGLGQAQPGPPLQLGAGNGADTAKPVQGKWMVGIYEVPPGIWRWENKAGDGKGNRLPSKESAAVAYDMHKLTQAGYSAREARELGLNYDLGLHADERVRRLLEKEDMVGVMPFSKMSRTNRRVSTKQTRLTLTKKC